MGGGPEDDAAARRFAESAAGGDIVVLRATGSLTSYPGLLLVRAGPQSLPGFSGDHSHEHATARRSSERRLPPRQGGSGVAGGGSQWDYLGRWPGAVHRALAGATQRGASIGGTSAGAVSLGEAAFDARHGTVTSAEALADPAQPAVSVGPSTLPQPELANVIVDSHFTERSARVACSRSWDASSPCTAGARSSASASTKGQRWKSRAGSTGYRRPEVERSGCMRPSVQPRSSRAHRSRSRACVASGLPMKRRGAGRFPSSRLMAFRTLWLRTAWCGLAPVQRLPRLCVR